MKLIFIMGPSVAGAVGCARFNSTQTDVSYDEKGNPSRQITTRATASTFFAGNSSLASGKASLTDKTQGASVGSLSQEANADTNASAFVEPVVGAAVRIEDARLSGRSGRWIILTNPYKRASFWGGDTTWREKP